MLDEIKTITIESKNNKVELTPDFMAFKKLHKNTGNAFKVMDEFVNNSEKRVEHLPLLIQSMADKELTIQEIEKDFLGMQWSRVMQMANVIFELINAEYTEDIEVEENTKNTEVPKNQKK